MQSPIKIFNYQPRRDKLLDSYFYHATYNILITRLTIKVVNSTFSIMPYNLHNLEQCILSVHLQNVFYFTILNLLNFLRSF